MLGAIASRTTTIKIATGVTCPIIRMHPVVIAQAAATASLLLDGRFSIGVGAGEALNEHITGERWPPPEVRREMLAEAVSIMRRLWTGEVLDHHGGHFVVENARLFDPPAATMPVIVSGFGDASTELAARIGDGFWGHGTDRWPVDHYRACGGRGPTYAQIDVCAGDDVGRCRKVVAETWPNGAIPGQLLQDLPTWSHFEQAAALVAEDDVTGSVTLGNDAGAFIDAAERFADAGFDHIYFHQIGSDQDAFLSLWERELRDHLID